VINKDLLRETLAYIEVHPEEWDQTKWICDTTACFAGRACLLSGDRPHGSVYEDGERGIVSFGTNSWGAIRHRAEELLGLTWIESERLFSMSNTLDDLRRIVAELCERE
jgi:hypothetical protein